MSAPGDLEHDPHSTSARRRPSSADPAVSEIALARSTRDVYTLPVNVADETATGGKGLPRLSLEGTDFDSERKGSRPDIR
jgi:hypothetical protein